MATHTLKTIEPYFSDVLRGHKTFEIRKNDRHFHLNDTLILKKYCESRGYLGPEVRVEVVYMTCYQQEPGYIVMGIRAME